MRLLTQSAIKIVPLEFSTTPVGLFSPEGNKVVAIAAEEINLILLAPSVTAREPLKSLQIPSGWKIAAVVPVPSVLDAAPEPTNVLTFQ